LIGENLDDPEETAPWLDATQGGFFHDFLAARTTQDFRKIVDNPTSTTFSTPPPTMRPG